MGLGGACTFAASRSHERERVDMPLMTHHSALRVRPMTCQSMKARRVFAASLVALDHRHHCRFANNCQPWPDAVLDQPIRKRLGPEAAYFLIVSDRDMQRLPQLQSCEFRRFGHNGRQETLHVTSPAPIEASVTLEHPKRIAGPILTLHRDNIGVPGQHDTTRLIRSQRSKHIRLPPVRGRLKIDPCPNVPKPFGDIGNHREIAVCRNRGERDEFVQ